MKDNVKKLVFIAMMAALTCAATMVIRIPTPGTGGYIHPGDALVVLSGVLLEPLGGFLAGGLGSAMADLAAGYALYAPFTLVIKGLIALAAALLYRKAPGGHRTLGVALGGVADVILVAGGYFLCDSLLYGMGGALASVPANLIQGASGLVLAVPLQVAAAPFWHLQKSAPHTAAGRAFSFKKIGKRRSTVQGRRSAGSAQWLVQTQSIRPGSWQGGLSFPEGFFQCPSGNALPPLLH